MCQGLPSQVSSQMTFKTKSARFWGIPFGRVDHRDCPLWFVAVSATGLSSVRVHRCDKCSNLMYYLQREANKRKSITPEHKAARVLASSHFPIKYLSPASLQQRKRLISLERKALKQKVNHLCYITIRSIILCRLLTSCFMMSM